MFFKLLNLSIIPYRQTIKTLLNSNSLIITLLTDELIINFVFNPSGQYEDGCYISNYDKNNTVFYTCKYGSR